MESLYERCFGNKMAQEVVNQHPPELNFDDGLKHVVLGQQVSLEKFAAEGIGSGVKGKDRKKAIADKVSELRTQLLEEINERYQRGA